MLIVIFSIKVLEGYSAMCRLPLCHANSLADVKKVSSCERKVQAYHGLDSFYWSVRLKKVSSWKKSDVRNLHYK